MAEAARKTAGISSRAEEQRKLIFDKFRRWGYLSARLDPLGFLSPVLPPELEDSGDMAAQARAIYCGTIGAEFMHIADPQRREWIAGRMERPPAAKPDHERILERLIRAELFEQALQARFVGTKRYSLEGLAVLIVCWVEATSSTTSALPENIARLPGARSKSIWCRIPVIWKRSIQWRWGARVPSRRALASKVGSVCCRSLYMATPPLRVKESGRKHSIWAIFPPTPSAAQFTSS
jgi:hypothetical protein